MDDDPAYEKWKERLESSQKETANSYLGEAFRLALERDVIGDAEKAAFKLVAEKMLGYVCELRHWEIARFTGFDLREPFATPERQAEVMDDARARWRNRRRAQADPKASL